MIEMLPDVKPRVQLEGKTGHLKLSPLSWTFLRYSERDLCTVSILARKRLSEPEVAIGEGHGSSSPQLH